MCVVYLGSEPRKGFQESGEGGQGRNVGSPAHVMEQVAAVGTWGSTCGGPGGTTCVGLTQSCPTGWKEGGVLISQLPSLPAEG